MHSQANPTEVFRLKKVKIESAALCKINRNKDWGIKDQAHNRQDEDSSPSRPAIPLSSHIITAISSYLLHIGHISVKKLIE